MKIQRKARARAIIFFEDKIVSMYREFDGRVFYTFPGGGMEENETEEQCVVREVFEEFGLVVEPIKKVYVYDGERGVEHFFVCKWISGEFGSGEGEEFQPDRNRGVYKPVLIKIADIPSLPLMPPEIATNLVADYELFGENLRDDVIIVNKSEDL